MTAILAGVASGLASFIGAFYLLHMVLKDRKGAQWLEPHWQKANANGDRQADALTRIAIALEKLSGESTRDGGGRG